MDAEKSMFDLSALAQQYGMPQETLTSLIKQSRSEFGDDDMMVELHVIRAIRRLRFNDEKKAAQA